MSAPAIMLDKDEATICDISVLWENYWETKKLLGLAQYHRNIARYKELRIQMQDICNNLRALGQMVN